MLTRRKKAGFLRDLEFTSYNALFAGSPEIGPSFKIGGPKKSRAGRSLPCVCEGVFLRKHFRLGLWKV